MKLLDSPTLTGIIKVDLIYADRVVPYYKEENLIVLSSRQKILSTLYLPGIISDPITTLQAGIGGSIDPQGDFPKPVSRDMTALYNSVLSTNASYTVNSTTPSVTFISDISESQAVGQLINEAGLFTASGDMFNIKTFPAIPKTSEFGIHIEWTINFS